MLLLRNATFEIRKRPCGHVTAQKLSIFKSRDSNLGTRDFKSCDFKTLRFEFCDLNNACVFICCYLFIVKYNVFAISRCFQGVCSPVI